METHLAVTLDKTDTTLNQGFNQDSYQKGGGEQWVRWTWYLNDFVATPSLSSRHVPHALLQNYYRPPPAVPDHFDSLLAVDPVFRKLFAYFLKFLKVYEVVCVQTLLEFLVLICADIGSSYARRMKFV